MLDLLALGGGEILGELGDLSIEIGGYTVGSGAFDSVLYKAEDLDAHKVGAAEGDGGVVGVEGMQLYMIRVVDHLFDEGFVAIDEDYGDAAAIDAWLFMDLDHVAVLNLRGHAVAGDFDTDGFVRFALGVDVYGHIFCNEVLSYYAEACANRFIDGDHAGLGGIQDDSVAVDLLLCRGFAKEIVDGDAKVVGDFFEGCVVGGCAVFPFGD